MDRIEVMYYYYFIVKRKEKEMEEMKEAKKGKDDSNTMSFETPAPEGAKSWDEWLAKYGEVS